MVKKSMVAIALALSPVAAFTNDCSGQKTGEDEWVRDIWEPGHYPGHDQWYCMNKAQWLIKIEWSPSGRITSRCVTPRVGKKQKIGTVFQP